MPDDLTLATTFFTDFDRASSGPDLAWLSAAFADTFLVVDPNGSMPVTREQFLGSLGLRKQLFEKMRVSALRLAAVESADGLDDRHLQVRTRWRAVRTEPGLEEFELAVTYLLRHDDAGIQVLVYLNHQDLAAVAAAHG